MDGKARELRINIGKIEKETGQRQKIWLIDVGELIFK